MKDWFRRAGDWKVTDSVLCQTRISPECVATAGNFGWKDYTLRLKARKRSGEEGFLILFRVADEKNYRWWNIGGWGNRTHGLERVDDGHKSKFGNMVGGSIEAGRWYDVRVEVVGNHIRCWLDDMLIHDVTEASMQPQTITAGAGLVEKTGEWIVKVVNYSPKPQTANIALQGTTSRRWSGTRTELTSGSPNDENTLEEPRKVLPKTSKFGLVGPRFKIDLPAWSFTVLKLSKEP
ncbi:MAG: DUF1080 domain-containing protein [Pirellulales bacterium]|nr:DUF1080 domain-containing protein [Pirellulales bacterium]